MTTCGFSLRALDRTASVSTFAPGHRTHVHRILLRDYLRRHPESATAYGALKRRLALEAIDDWDYYTGSKGPFVAEIVQRATEEIDWASLVAGTYSSIRKGC